MWIRLRWIAIDPLLVVVLAFLAGVGQLGVGLFYFGLILVHELAHVLVAYRFGMRVARVELTPLGGRAYIPELNVVDPSAEISIALAGPLTNLILGVGPGLVVAALGVVPDRDLLVVWQQINLSLAFFNLLPGLPLDGGRILRALLTPRLGWIAATRTAAHLGEWWGLASTVAGAALIWRVGGVAGMSFVLTGIFLLVAARREGETGSFAFQLYVLERVRSSSVVPGRMREGRWLVAAGDESLQAVVHRFLPHRYNLVMVVDRSGRPRGWVAEGELFSLARRYGLGISLQDAVGRLRGRGIGHSSR
ncbi:MAG: M50 family metallopeptidase [Limnochordales bacterium]|nr:M50 family metallopeptidase [Limnochordales bacterium]